jgi:hypothetical protein
MSHLIRFDSRVWNKVFWIRPVCVDKLSTPFLHMTNISRRINFDEPDEKKEVM